MATVRVEPGEVVVHLSPGERLGALHGDLHIPRAAIRAATVTSEPYSLVRGLKVPGTGWPGSIALGTWRHQGSRDFFAVRGKGPAVVLDLDPASSRYRRVVVTLDDPGAVVRQLAPA